MLGTRPAGTALNLLLSVTLLHALHSANWRRIVWKPILPARAHPLEPSPILALADGADPTLGPQARYSYLREEIVKYERTYKAM